MAGQKRAITHVVEQAVDSPDIGKAYIARVSNVKLRKGGLTIRWRITPHRPKKNGHTGY